MKKEDAWDKFWNVFNKEIQPLLTATWDEKNVYGYIQNLVKSIGAEILQKPPESMDIAIAVPNSANCLGVIEVKTSNSLEMINVADFNRKALWQILYYYLEGAFSQEERLNTLEYYIITDLQEWYLFDNRSFTNSLNRKTASRLASDIGLNTKNPALFTATSKNKAYEQLKTYCDNNPDFLISLKKNCIHISIPTLGDSTDQIRLLFERLYDMFCPNKEKPVIALNDNFYKELLYIMGLKEAKNEEKKVVELVYNGVPHTFANQLDPSLKDGDPLKPEDMQRLIIWFNRILFLKLLETSLIKFNGDDDSYKFLSSKRISDFPTLNKLFFRVLAVEESERADNDFEGVPYLNSSLFEEHEVEKGCNISTIPNEPVSYYSDTVLKDNSGKRRMGTARLLDYLLEFLDSYDFGSGKETTAGKMISPAVLGLVFEKLNGYKDGSYYTPENITSFMAEEAIKSSFLAQVNEALNVNYESYDMIKRSYIQSLFSNEDKETIKNLIMSMKILDPAVGSGHFLVSAMDVLLHMWYDFCVGPFETLIDYRLNNDNVLVDRSGKPINYVREQDKGKFSIDPAQQSVQKAFFEAKKYIIEHNLYGVDINPNAVEIAKLRLWIELLEHAYYKEPDYKQMETLPNLEFKIICADSLTPLQQSDGIQQSFLSPYIEAMKQLMHEYFEESDKARKEEIKTKRFSELLSQIKQAAAFGDGKVKDKLDTWNPFGNTPALFFDPKLMFGVSHFDVIITNPPYIQLQRNGGELGNKYEPYKYKTFDRTGDIYVLFIEKGTNLLKDNGVLCYITSNKWLRTKYGRRLREYLLDKKNALQVETLINLGPGVFENANVDTCIFSVRKTIASAPLKLKTLDLAKENIAKVDIAEYLQDPDKVAITTQLDSGPWFLGSSIEQQIKEKVEKVGTPLKKWNIAIFRGVVTGFNDAFIIDSRTREQILENCESKEERINTEKLIKPLLKGRDIERYIFKWNDRWLIATFPTLHLNIKDFPSLESYFLSKLEYFKSCSPNSISSVQNRTGNQWFETQSTVSYYKEFENEKLVWTAVNSRYKFAIVPAGYYLDNSLFLITGPYIKYFCGIFNSHLMRFYLTLLLSSEEEYTYGSKYTFSYVPIPQITDENKDIASAIESKVNQIIFLKQQNLTADTSELEAEIDDLVYDLYGFTTAERTYIESQMEA